MKKKFSIVIILLFVSLDLFAAVDYLAPMAATSGIPMDPKQVWNHDTKKPISGHYTPITNGRGAWQGGILANGYLDAGFYTDNEIIAIGGIKLMDKQNYYNSSYVLTASCSNGFYFVSQSNPDYKRPFELYIVPFAYKEYNSESGKNERIQAGDAVGKVEIFNDLNNRFEFKYSEMLGNTKLNISQNDFKSGSEPQLWFDMVLVLPGYVENNILKWPDHGEFPLTEANDYSAVVTLTLQATVDGIARTVQTVNIPFSGFYEKDNHDRDTEASVSMYIHPTAASGNIDMRNYSKQQIADIEVMTVKPTDSNRDNGFGVFVSSSPDPFVAGEPFKLVKENLKYEDALSLNDYNSVAYKVILIDNKNLQNQKTYDGTDSIPNINIGLFYDKVEKEWFWEKPTYLKPVIKAPPSSLMMPTALKVTPDSHSSKTDYWYLSSSAYIEIQGKPAVTMEAGRYTSTVYVHVIGFN